MSKHLYSNEYFGYFSLSDPAGIMFFQKAFDLAHQALEDYMNQTELGWKSWFQHPVWAVPLVHCEADFLSPIKSGENIKIDLFLEKNSESSLSFSYLLSQNHVECCKVNTTHVFISKESKTKIAIPKPIKDLLI